MSLTLEYSITQTENIGGNLRLGSVTYDKEGSDLNTLISDTSPQTIEFRLGFK